MFSISQFKSNVKIVRPNLFRAMIYPPSFISTRFNTSSFQYRCEATEMPGRTIATTDESSIGTTVKLPYDMTYNDINLQIIASEDMNERKMFESWMDGIVMPNNYSKKIGGMISHYDTYQGSVTISQLNDAGGGIVDVVLVNAYPIQLSPMNLNWEESNTYQRFTVTLAYRYHTTFFADPSSDAGPQRPPGVVVV